MGIRLTAINCSYGTQKILHQLTIDIASGATVALLGPSGAGKSTLLRVLNLLTRPQTGTLKIADQTLDFTQPISEKIVTLVRQQVGMVFQQYHLWPHMTVIANLLEAPKRVLRVNSDIAEQQALVLLERLGLASYTTRYPLQLSGGQQQRVAIARALMMQPQVLLFDEPTAAVDPEITAQIITIMQELSQSAMTQVIVTHDAELARKVATQVIYLDRGRIIEQGAASCLTQPKTPELAYYLSH
ncbi:MAG: arginine ABC transporter ATP-binding protein ArtP [Candidatus Symbiodolus clandestinus]